MSATMKATVHLGQDYQGNLRTTKNTDFEKVKQLFDISPKLIKVVKCMEMDPQKGLCFGPQRGAVAREVAGGPATPCCVFTSGSLRQEKDGEPQGDEIHSEGC